MGVHYGQIYCAPTTLVDAGALWANSQLAHPPHRDLAHGGAGERRGAPQDLIHDVPDVYGPGGGGEGARVVEDPHLKPPTAF